LLFPFTKGQHLCQRANTWRVWRSWTHHPSLVGYILSLSAHLFFYFLFFFFWNRDWNQKDSGTWCYVYLYKVLHIWRQDENIWNWGNVKSFWSKWKVQWNVFSWRI
jgi:hypothetical protein